MLIKVIEDQKHMSSRSDNFHPDRIVSMIELARCYEREGKLKSSIEICDETIQGMEKTAESGHPFIEIMKEARGKMEGLLKDVQGGGTELERTVEIRFPEYLFKIYSR
ncbi:hypothetical protein F5Y12DRAFT_773962 [Xylaria sp. FL1777]|nr:hypothetical protein F5Y12DRAFT_773962 [Xylaria sp. FL1777]